jgi:hypothetical protein
VLQDLSVRGRIINDKYFQRHSATSPWEEDITSTMIMIRSSTVEEIDKELNRINSGLALLYRDFECCTGGLLQKFFYLFIQFFWLVVLLVQPKAI